MVDQKEMKMFDVRLGDRVRWESAAGTIRGTVMGAQLAPNANNELIVWYTIEMLNGQKHRLCGNEGYLKMMKFTVIFRDGGLEAA